MSKSVLTEQIWLGGASSKGTTFGIALALIPHDSIDHFDTKNYDKLISVHEECPQYKQVKTAASKNKKFVQMSFSLAEDDLNDN